MSGFPPPAVRRYWTCPTNIAGLDPGSITRLIEDDLYDLLRPSLGRESDPESLFQIRRDRGAISYGRLQGVVDRRLANLTRFLRKVQLTIDTTPEIDPGGMPMKFRALSGDSHDGGRRPLLLETAKGRWVLKFADPRPHHLLAAVLGELSQAIGTDLRPPALIADSTHQWHLMPYLEPAGSGDHEVEPFMFSLGALTAVAYVLAMVDLHVENVVVADGRPVIVDPECILYNFPTESRRDRLISTGLLSKDPSLSAMRGGDTSRNSFKRVGLSERSDGGIDYMRRGGPFHNRMRTSSGKFADPSDYRRTLVGGFTAAFEWIMSHKRLMSDIVGHIVTDDFRIRFLVRTTRLYATTIHMLNFQVSCQYDGWRDEVFSKLRKAGHFPDALSAEVMAAEQDDLEARDVPYFWLHATESIVRHRTGPTQRMNGQWNARKQAIEDINTLTRQDMKAQIGVLDDFLDMDLCA